MIDQKIIRIGIINVSDRASQGIYEDIPGKAIVSTLNEYLINTWEKEYIIIPDEQALIEKAMIRMADEKKCCLIITSGGAVLLLPAEVQGLLCAMLHRKPLRRYVTK